MMSKRRTSVRPDAAIARRRHRRPTPDAKSSDWKIDEGLKGLYATVKHFRKAGEIADVPDGEAGVAKGAGRSTC